MNEQSNIEESQYGLRSRDTLRPPSRYVSQDQLQIHWQRAEYEIKTLKRKRGGKKN